MNITFLTNEDLTVDVLNNGESIGYIDRRVGFTFFQFHSKNKIYEDIVLSSDITTSKGELTKKLKSIVEFAKILNK